MESYIWQEEELPSFLAHSCTNSSQGPRPSGSTQFPMQDLHFGGIPLLLLQVASLPPPSLQFSRILVKSVTLSSTSNSSIKMVKSANATMVWTENIPITTKLEHYERDLKPSPIIATARPNVLAHLTTSTRRKPEASDSAALSINARATLVLRRAQGYPLFN